MTHPGGPPRYRRRVSRLSEPPCAAWFTSAPRCPRMLIDPRASRVLPCTGGQGQQGDPRVGPLAATPTPQSRFNNASRPRRSSPRVASRTAFVACVTRDASPITNRPAIHARDTVVRVRNHHASTCFSGAPFTRGPGTVASCFPRSSTHGNRYSPTGGSSVGPTTGGKASPRLPAPGPGLGLGPHSWASERYRTSPWCSAPR